MKAKNDVVMGEKKCKKCGDPIRSTSIVYERLGLYSL